MTFSISTHAATNRLIDSSSPYLLQHAHNPVDWYPWGEEAFAKARTENKPILLSIGYSTCYWCHVMEREIFENPEIAKLMNESIVSIKIDREQRPDVDELYMMATQMMTHSGGWPNNVFVTPDLKPFYAGTYFPPADFTSLIEQIHYVWMQDQVALKAQAERLASAIIQIKQQENNAQSSSLPGSRLVEALISHFSDYYDNRLGGFYQAPKFPNEDALLFLLEAYRLTNNNTCLEMARGTLEKMAAGGIHDHVGGGFHRYATDAQWRIPHFEKMLYNQALLGRAYTELYALSDKPDDRAVAEGIFDFTLRQMTDKDGGFYSALDAETDAVEGAYYAWTDAELYVALDADSCAWLVQHYGLAEIPKIPGHKHEDGRVLYLNQPLSGSAIEKGLSYEDTVNKQQAVMTALREARDKRKLPHLDNKIITSWNGLMIDAFARAGQRIGKPEYTDAARRAADFILSNLRKQDGALYRTWRDGKAEIAAYFEDYAFMIQGLVSIYRAAKEDSYLQAAKELAAKAKQLFWDEKHGGYYFTDGSEQLLVRMKNAMDSAIPSGNAVMAQALLDLYEIIGDAEWKQQAEALLIAFGQVITENPRAYTHMVHALLRLNHLAPAAKAAQQPDEAVIKKGAMETKAYVKVSASEPKREGNSLTVTAVLDIAQGWHVNANPASFDFLISTSVDVREDSGKAEVKPTYPEAQAMTTPLGDINVYEGKVSIPVKVTLPGNAENIRLLVRAQACKDAACLAPSDWIIPVKLK
ncbi:DUF255 domain-containing protein [Methylobacter svalbardensis]|uniref:DUF255 domain-containing protein n=1 Tax=Methylobacter svalbardensis TaxID=3080016 RepID=UPI0030EDE816